MSPTRRSSSIVQRIAAALLAVLGAALVIAGSPAPQRAAAAPPGAEAFLALGESYHFSHFTVTVSAVRRNWLWYGVEATTCLTSLPPGHRDRVPVSWAPWSVRTSSGKTVRATHSEGGPGWSDEYRDRIRLAVGQCVRGWLPFPVEQPDQVTRIWYANSLGDKAAWSPATSPLRLGQTRRFAHFAVTAVRVERHRSWYGVHARVCLTSRPVGTSGDVRVSWSPWSLQTPYGRPPLQAPPQSGGNPVPGLFPSEDWLTVGECTSGLLPFAASSRVPVLAVRYANSLGNSVVWSTR